MGFELEAEAMKKTKKTIRSRGLNKGRLKTEFRRWLRKKKKQNKNQALDVQFFQRCGPWFRSFNCQTFSLTTGSRLGSRLLPHKRRSQRDCHSVMRLLCVHDRDGCIFRFLLHHIFFFRSNYLNRFQNHFA